jgi:hypothetical protein
MTQVIIHTNENGGVSVTYPTGELPINEVLAKDCPEGAIIVNDSELPTEDFDFWILNNGVVTVDTAKKAAIQVAKQAKITAKESAQAKLAALGLTTDEVKAILGTA